MKCVSIYYKVDTISYPGLIKGVRGFIPGCITHPEDAANQMSCYKLHMK